MGLPSLPFNVPLRELDIKFHLEVRNWVRRESTFHVLVLSAAAAIFVVLMSSSWTTDCLLTLFLPLQPILGNCTKFWPTNPNSWPLTVQLRRN